MPDLIHPFERAGLGKAPFRFIGSERKTFQAHPGAPIQVGGSCDYCGTGIIEHCYIRSADGKTFKVGCDCVMKTHHKGTPLYTAAEKALKAARKATKETNERARIKAAKAALEENPELLADRPHSRKWAADKGMTARDEVLWYLAHAGRQGQMMATKAIEAAVHA
jgi:hypothetical protein